MTLTPGMLDAMAAAGLSADQIVAVTKAALAADEAAAEAKRAKRRAGNAERQRRFRERRNADVTPHNAVTERDEPTLPNPLGSNITPPKGGDDNNASARDPHRMPAGFSLSDEDLQFARDLGWTDAEISDEEAGFVDYWSNPKLPGSKALKTNWSATWRNRIRDMSKRRGHGARASPMGAQLALVHANGSHANVQANLRKSAFADELAKRKAANPYFQRGG